MMAMERTERLPSTMHPRTDFLLRSPWMCQRDSQASAWREKVRENLHPCGDGSKWFPSSTAASPCRWSGYPASSGSPACRCLRWCGERIPKKFNMIKLEIERLWVILVESLLFVPWTHHQGYQPRPPGPSSSHKRDAPSMIATVTNIYDNIGWNVGMRIAKIKRK